MVSQCTPVQSHKTEHSKYRQSLFLNYSWAELKNKGNVCLLPRRKLWIGNLCICRISKTIQQIAHVAPVFFLWGSVTHANLKAGLDCRYDLVGLVHTAMFSVLSEPSVFHKKRRHWQPWLRCPEDSQTSPGSLGQPICHVTSDWALLGDCRAGVTLPTQDGVLGFLAYYIFLNITILAYSLPNVPRSVEWESMGNASERTAFTIGHFFFFQLDPL